MLSHIVYININLYKYKWIIQCIGVDIMKSIKKYNPITATPYKYNDEYAEYEPCDQLKPYIRCFWGNRVPHYQRKTNIISQGLVIPDTCMDIIFDVDFTFNKINGSFCGINDRSFKIIYRNDEDRIVSSFGIRFYPWSVIYFIEDSLCDVKNGHFNVEQHFSKLKKKIEPLLFDVVKVEERIQIVQKYLMDQIHLERRNEYVMESIAKMIFHKGNIDIFHLSKDVHTSTRHLERLYKEYIGISPKQLTSLVRYQYLWNDIISNSNFNVLDAAFKYGYTDQAHLLRDFKKYHTMTIPEAKKHALQHVAFLQEEIS